MKAIIIDDDRKAAEQLREALAAFPQVQIAGTACKAASGIKLFKEQKPDVVFLDVEMPDMSGLDVLDELDTDAAGADVVMCTAYESYMLPAFRGSAFDFLLKPIDKEELATVVQRLSLSHDKRRQAAKAPAENAMHKRKDDSFIFYTNTTDFRVVKLRDIGVFQYNHEVRVWEVIIDGCDAPRRLRRSVTNEQIIALDECFAQVNQKYIINIAYIQAVEDNNCIFYPPFENITHVRVGRFFRRRFLERFNKI